MVKIENWSKICRMCLKELNNLKSIFGKWDEIDLPSIIKDSLNLQVCL